MSKDHVLNLRVVTPEDAEELLKIYEPYVQKTAITFEWDVPTVQDFKSRIEHTLQTYPYIAAVKDGRIVGYAYVSPFKTRKAYDWAVQTSIYVEEEQQHSGIGGVLYAALERILQAMNIINVNACIGYPEVQDEYLTKNSVQFHEHLGYQWVGEFHRCGYKFGRWYNMVWMEKMLTEHPQIPQDIIPFPMLSDELVQQLLTEK